ncbi:MAG TPA: glycosyltransferase [Bacteroidota bacterium]|nr:glycosyltransferase [Bacteroidota bacterium]
MHFSAFETILIILVSFYCLTIVGLILGLLRLRPGSSREAPFVSVIVAARNEENNIDSLLTAITEQTYTNYEIVIANDRSEDGTRALIESWQRKDRRIVLVNINNLSRDMPAKKNALTAAISASRGEILCFTDADCQPPRTWLSELVRHFEPEVGMVAGYSPYRHSQNTTRDGFLAEVLFRFIQFEEFKGSLWAAGAVGLRFGWLCTGRNLAYRREVFDEVGGFEKIKMSISGDDDLFMQLVRRETHWQISYATSPESHVPTVAPRSFREFLEQRKRHFSAAKYFTPSMKVFFFLFHLSNLILLTSFLYWLAIPRLTEVILWAFVAKTTADASLLLAGGRVLRESNMNPSFLLLEILYVFYNTFIGPLGLIRKFEWKTQPK